MLMTQRYASTIAASNDNIARAIREASEATIQAARITSDSETAVANAKLKQERQMFEAEQSVKDRVDISLKEYTELKSALEETTKSLNLYKDFVTKILDRVEDKDRQSIISLVQKNKFNIISDIDPISFSHKVGIIFKIEDFETFKFKEDI